MLNLNAIMDIQKPVMNTVKPRGGTWVKDTSTKQMLKYLNDHGETSGKELRKAIGIYPTSVLHPKINKGQVLVRVVSKYCHLYRLDDNHDIDFGVDNGPYKVKG